MKTPTTQIKKTEQQQEASNKNPHIVQKKQANISNPFLPNNNSNPQNPFGNVNNNSSLVGQMKTAQKAVAQRVPNNNSPRLRRQNALPTVEHNENYNKLNGTADMNGTEGEQSTKGDAMDYAEDAFGNVNDGLGATADHNDTQSLIAKTALAREQGISVEELSEEDAENAETGREAGKIGGQDTITGITGSIGGLLTMGSAIKAWGDSEDNWDKAGALLQGGGGVADVVSNIAGLFGADKISAIADSVSAVIGTIKTTLEVIKSLKELKDMEGDKKDAKLDIAKNAASGVKQGFVATQKIMQAIGSVAPPAVTQAVPVLSIIFSVIDIIQEAFALIEAVKNYRAMGEEKSALKQDADSSHFTKMEKRGFIGFRKEKQVTNQEQLEKAKTGNIGGNLTQDRKDEIAEKAKNYDMVRNLRKINKERIIRSSTNIGLNVVNIIGDIAILTGAGAPVGVIIKTSAGIIKGGLKLFRGAKQLYNNIKGNENSSANQHKRRMEQIKYIFSLTKSMTTFPTNTNVGREKANAMGNKISKYISAMGTNVDAFVKYKTEPDKAIKLLYSALKKREAGDKVEAK